MSNRLHKRKRITLFDVVVTAITVVLVVIILFPLINVLACSVSSPTAVATGKVVLWPVDFTLEGYRRVFQDEAIMRGYANTIFYTVVGTIINMLVTVPAAYALSKSRLPGMSKIMLMILFTMYFSGGMIPTFIIVTNLGLYDTRAILLILGAFNTYNCIVCRTFFSGLPHELEEAAHVDGASVLHTFVSVVLPVSKALLGVMVLYFAVAHWNSYFNALIYTSNRAFQPLQLVLRNILIEAQTSADMLANAGSGADELAGEMQHIASLLRYSVIVVSSLPLMIVYPFLQKYFEKGAMLGSVKG